MMLRLLYSLLLALLLPYVVFHLLWRSRRQPEYRRHIGERFGIYEGKTDAPLIWLHAVSVGETRAAAPLIALLRERYPQHRILLTHMTPTGREAGRQLFGDSVQQCYLPYDYPFAVRRFFTHFKPAIGLLMETELWFNLVHAAQKAEIPLLLVNARMSEKSARKYARFSSLTAASLRSLSAIAAQSPADAQRLTQLGAPAVQVTGNLKFDLAVPQHMLEAGQALRGQFGRSRPVLLAASTREGEEALLLPELGRIVVPGLLSVIVPRHPQRFDQVAELLERQGIRYQRRSANRPVAPETQVVLGDSMGEMLAYYAACDLAFIGGSLLPLGGQNLIEAAALGKPVLIGPHTFNFSEATELAMQCGAALRVSNAAELAKTASELLNDRERLQAMSKAASEFAGKHRGAAERLMTLIEPYMSAEC